MAEENQHPPQPPERPHAAEPPTTPADHARKAEAERRRRLIAIATNLTYAVVITAVILIAKDILESTAPVQSVEIGTYKFLQSRLSNFSGNRLQVVVVDISKVDEVSKVVAGQVKKFTPRDRLTEVIQALVDAKAAAIGVDIDFSPDEDGPIDRDNDWDFFDKCLAWRATVPIRLGVYRARERRPDEWLSVGDYSKLAADVAATRPELGNTYRVNEWVALPAQHQALPSLGYALAQDYFKRHRPPHQPPDWLRRLLRQPVNPADLKEASSSASEDTDEDEEERPGQLLNYSKLAQLQSERLLTTHKVSIEDAAQDFYEKIVIIGDATLRNGGDQFNPPWGNSTPGVFFHASAAYTFAVEPLHEFTPLTRTLLDIALGLPFFAIAAIKAKQAKHPDDEAAEKHWNRVEKGTLYVSALIVLGIGLFLMLNWHVMWLDFILVILALAAHPLLSNKVEALGKFWAALSAQRAARKRAAAK